MLKLAAVVRATNCYKIFDDDLCHQAFLLLTCSFSHSYTEFHIFSLIASRVLSQRKDKPMKTALLNVKWFSIKLEMINKVVFSSPYKILNPISLQMLQNIEID
jgi:hypothetical protein